MTLRRAQAVLLAVSLASACRPPDVVAEVGDRRVTQGDVRAWSKLHGAAAADDALDALIAQERLAAEATRRALQDTPAVKARLRAAEREILSQALLDADVPMPDEKTLQAAYDASTTLAVRQLELAHLFISSPPGSSTEAVTLAQSRANAAWARLLGGDAFELVVKELSEDTVTRDKGGVLGVVREGQVAQELFDAAAALELGATSKPIQTPFGFHVIKALSKVATVKPPFAEVRGKLEKELRDAKLAELRGRLEKSVKVSRYDEPLAELKKEAR